MRQVFQPEWRTQNRLKRRFYSKYITWLERIGYLVVAGVVAAFLFAFNYRVDDLVTAEAVKLAPFASPIKATGPTQIVRVIHQDFDEVKAGEPVLEIVEGDLAIEAYGKWQKVDSLKLDAGASPEFAKLALRFPKPSTRILMAPAAGTFRFDAKQTLLDADAEICRVVDYTDIRLSASLAGDSISKAMVGQWAKISNLDLGASTGTLFRANSPSGSILSSQILSDSMKKDLAGRLKGMAVRFRDDVPLSISDVSEIQVDANVGSQSTNNANAAPLAPSPSYALQAQVVDGSPAASAQVADLPADIQQDLIQKVRSSVDGKPVKGLGGGVEQLSNASNIHLLVKVKTQKAAPDGTPTMAGTPLKRTFEATLKIQSPPAFLIQALRDADRNGKDVTARVELRTGSRPIAFILLKKS